MCVKVDFCHISVYNAAGNTNGPVGLNIRTVCTNGCVQSVDYEEEMVGVGQ